MPEKHTCKALAITCIDFRFVSKTRDFLIKKGFAENYDLISFPGASLHIKNLKEAIQTSVKRHQPKLFYLIDHENCGAFGNADPFESHVLSLKKAVQFIEETFPSLQTKAYLAGFTGIKKIDL